MQSLRWIGVLVAFALFATSASAGVFFGRNNLDHVNRRIQGRVIDHTGNHGQDHRLWSPSLGEKRDLYVYLPPGYSPHNCYPLMVWLHGFGQDEQDFLKDLVEPLDKAICAGKLPPLVVVAPDGSIDGNCSYTRVASFFLNTPKGRFEDYLMTDVWNFIHSTYSICPEREAHLIAGVSMGGGAAYNMSFKYRERFRYVLGIFPPLNTRWSDCHDRYMGNFSPDCWHWKSSWDKRREVIARFYCLLTLRTGQVIHPLYGRKITDAELLPIVIAENPAEMLFAYDIKPGELEMFVAYGGRDEFNMDAQIESFLFLARSRGICPTVRYEPRGRHNQRTAFLFWDDTQIWVSKQLAAYYTPHCRTPK